jgi:hypothetical protein
METNNESQKLKDNISITEFLDLLKHLTRDELPESKPAIKVGELRALLGRINIFNLSAWVENEILNVLELYKNKGAPAVHIWTYIRNKKEGRGVKLEEIESAIEKLIKANSIKSDVSAHFTMYFLNGSIHIEGDSSPQVDESMASGENLTP